MTRNNLFASILLTAAIGSAAVAQAPIRMNIRPDSKLVLAGSSNVHDWSCKSASFVATVDVDAAFLLSPLTEIAKPISAVSVTVPVKSLKCGHGKMDDNMYKALQAEQFTDISYALTSYVIDTATATADSFSATTRGELTVSGKTITVEIPVKAERQASGAAIGEGTVKLLMTDFGIKPPTALLGTLRTRNEIEISFRVLLDKSVVVALWQP